MSASGAVPAVLADVLQQRSLKTRWKRLAASDRAAYAAWVAAAGDNEKRSRRRAVEVGDRVAAGRGWAGLVRRRVDRLFAVRKRTTAKEALDADAGNGWAGWVPDLD